MKERHIIQKHYSTIREVFGISRFEPFIHTENCYYSSSLLAEELLNRSESSLIHQYYKFYGKMSQMRLSSILDELVRVEILKTRNGFYYGEEKLWGEMLKLKQELPLELAPLRA